MVRMVQVLKSHLQLLIRHPLRDSPVTAIALSVGNVNMSVCALPHNTLTHI